MIVWLASYPRSGNTLLRTVLKQTMGLDSFPERTEWAGLITQGMIQDEASPYYGELLPEKSWESFYPDALRSPELHLIKTHEAPLDDCPAIYVVRDGRKASHSYFHYHRSYLAGLGRSLLQIIVGDDYYGDWTSHYLAWINRASAAPLLVLRYEDLHHATPDLTAKIAHFLKLDISPKPWVNPFAEVRSLNPRSFREGLKHWTQPAEWDDGIAWAFSVFHSTLMESMGYTCDAGGFSRVDKRTTAEKIMQMWDGGMDQRRCIPRPTEETQRVRAILQQALV